MLKTLLKKQLLELNYGFFYDQKKGKMRSKASSIVFIALYALLMIGFVGGMFGLFCTMVCGPLVEAGMGWFYFTIFGLFAIAMGVFGSVFNTYSGLYLAKDNDLLLSMPIPVRYLLTVRLAGVYLMGLMFSAIVILPAIVVYLFVAPFSVSALLGCIVLLAVISVVCLVLSCILGWAVAKISLKLKNKSFITVILSLVFIGAYYLVYFRATELLSSLVENAVVIGGKIKAAAYPLYVLGKTGEGDFGAMAAVILATAAVAAITVWVLSRSFIKIATSSGNTEKVKYRAHSVKQESVSSALLRKELMRFTSSANYMLNCGLGILMLVIAAVMLVIKGQAAYDVLSEFFGAENGVIAVLAAGAVCLIASMNDITAPSVSLEGKSVWISQSLPITPWQALRAKLDMHLLLTEIPTLLCTVCAAAALHLSVGESILVVILPMLYTLLFALIGLFADLKKPNLKWTNEIVPVKQNISAMFVIFGGWAYSTVLIGLYFLFFSEVSAWIYLGAAAVLTAAVSAILFRWIKTKGAKVFAAL